MHRLGGKPNFKKGRMSGISYQSTTEWADDKQEARKPKAIFRVSVVPACSYLGPAHVIVYIVLRSRARRASECMN